MNKKTSQTRITATAADISRVMDRILKRWPKQEGTAPRRDEKQALLNDFAAEVMPGKNWGGLLASAGETSIPSDVSTGRRERLKTILSELLAPSPDAVPIGARTTWHEGARQLVEMPVMLDEELAAVCLKDDGMGILLGVCLRVIQTRTAAQIEIEPLLLYQNQDFASAVFLDVPGASHELASLLYRQMSAASGVLWSDYLADQGINDAYLVFTPAHAVAVVPIELLRDRLLMNSGVRKMDALAIRFIADLEARPDAVSDMEIVARLLSEVLPDMSLAWSDGADHDFKVVPDVSPPLQALVGDLIAGLPKQRSRNGFWSRKSPDADWMLAAGDLSSSLEGTSLYPLSQALMLALRAEGATAPGGLSVHAVIDKGHRSTGSGEVISMNWQVVVFENGGYRPWTLTDADAMYRLRSNVEAWLGRRPSTRLAPHSELTDEAIEVLAEAAEVIHGRDWEHAVALFGIGLPPAKMHERFPRMNLDIDPTWVEQSRR